MAKSKKKKSTARRPGKTRIVARSSKTGRFVKMSYFKAHPATTEIERIRTGRKKKGIAKPKPRESGAHDVLSSGPHGTGEGW